MASLGIEPTAEQRQKTSLNCVTTTPQDLLNLKNNPLFYYIRP
jgi:type IV secretory pathway TrbF-like protein